MSPWLESRACVNTFFVKLFKKLFEMKARHFVWYMKLQMTINASG